MTQATLNAATIRALDDSDLAMIVTSLNYMCYHVEKSAFYDNSDLEKWTMLVNKVNELHLHQSQLKV